MSLFISQLLIILALGLMVQTAPISPTKRSTEAELREKLKSEAEALINARGNQPTPNITEFTNNSTAAKVFNLSSTECQDFTIVMTLKHQVLDCIFNAIAQDHICDNLLTIDSKKLSTILTSLQTMASIFNKLELKIKKSSCVELTPDQYKMMYEARYNTTEVIQSLNELRKHYQSLQNSS